MNGAEALLATAVACGVEVCFANPGTTELDLVAAIDDVEGIRAVPALFEGVCSGAADGYARIAGKPALTLTHLGPGFANSLANVHNARRARTPMINIIGDHATWHLDADAPLTSDIAGLAAPMSIEIAHVDHADEAGPALAALFARSMAAPGGPTSLIIRQDAAWSVTRIVGTEPEIPDRRVVAPERVNDVAARLRTEPVAILLGGDALGADSLRNAGAIAAATGADLLVETFVARMDRGRGIPAPHRLPYFPEPARAAIDGHDAIVLIGAIAPVAFFGYREGFSSLVPDGVEIVELAGPGDDGAGALAALVEQLEIDVAPGPDDDGATDGGDHADATPLDPAVLGDVLASWLPEDAIVVDESTTSGAGFAAAAADAAPHTVLGVTGGAIGQGLPAAVGAAIAAPDRPVVALQADGSAAYTAQALWTMAREELDVTIVLCSNRSYRILQIELARSGKTRLGAAAGDLTDLDRPAIDWVALAAGLGVAGTDAATAGELRRALERARRTAGPFLIEAALP